jgi:hypothetical protein
MIGCEVYPAFYSWSEPLARKEHRCCECGGRIVVGERYFKGVGKWEGDINVHCQHLLCMEACMFIRDKIQGDCISFGSLMDYYHEYRLDFMPTENGRKLARMMVKIRKAKKARRQ